MPDPNAVTDLATFRAQASAAVCDWSVRCDWGVLGDSFCHPSFAARVGGSGPLDLVQARACVAQLASAADCDGAWTVADECYAINGGQGAGLVGEGDPCACSRFGCQCSLGLACVAGICTRTLGLGAPCDAAHPCSFFAGCIGGVCAHLGVDDVCRGPGVVAGCAPGLVCGPQVCMAAPPTSSCVASRGQRHHVGCTCANDLDCPTDVAVCSNGICALRPFVGSPCTIGGPPCFGSRCDASGTCVLLTLGQGPCGENMDCESGLVCLGSGLATGSARCAAALSLGQGPCTFDANCARGLVCGGADPVGGHAGVCVAPVGIGAACGPGVLSECRAGCCIQSRCTAESPRGGPCGVAMCPCEAGLSCTLAAGGFFACE